MKILLTAAALIIGCASPLTFAQTSPADITLVPRKDENPVALTSVKEPSVESQSANLDPDERLSVDMEQASLDKRIASTKFVSPSTDRPLSKVNEALSKDPVARKQDQSASSSDWQFSFAPYLFAAGISGTVGARGRTLEVDVNFAGGVLENLDFGLMGALEARKGRFIMFSDLIWTKLSKEEDTPGPLYDTAKLGLNLLIIDPEIGYRVVDSEQGSLDVLGGVRIWSVETNLNVTTGVLEGFDVSERKTWGAPVIGVRGTVNVTPKFFLTGKADIGGFSWAADLTSQLFGAAGYRVHKNIALLGGYRWLQVEYDDGSGFLFDTQMHGLILGAKFSF